MNKHELFVLLARAAIALVGLDSFVAAQTPEESTAPQSPPGAQIEESIDLARLVDRCAEKLQLDVRYEPERLTGTVTLRRAEGLSDDELWTLTNRALVSRGFTTIQMPGEETITVVELDKAGSLARLEQTELSRARAGFAKVVHGLKYASPAEVLPTIQQVMSESGVLALALGNTNSILLADLRPNLEQVFQLLELLDTAPAETMMEVPLLHVEPDALVSLVELLAIAQASVHGLQLKGKLLPSRSSQAVTLIAPLEERGLWLDMISRMDQRKEIRTLSYTPRSLSLVEAFDLVEAAARGAEAGGLGEDWKLVVDELTGSLVMTATPGQHQRAAEVLERVDARTPLDSQPVRVFSIRNRSSMELADLLNRLVGTGFLSLPEPRSSEEPNLSVPTPGPESLSVPLPPATQEMTFAAPASQQAGYGKLMVSADAATNTLFATGDVNLIDKLEGLIETLDVMASQVMLEVLILNLSDSDAVDLGVEIRGVKDEGTITSLSSLFGLGAIDPTDLMIPSVSGFTGVVLNPGDFSVLVNALQVLNEGRALNIPKVLVNSNQTANLASVLQTPFLSTNATTVVATTTFGGTQDAGTTIEVRPQIAEGDHLVLEYSIVLSTFVGPASDPSLPPPRQQNNLKSIATIPDGYTVALGGLETTSETEGLARVPILGSLPLIGWLFRSQSTLTSHSRFYVFIRASILRGADFQHLKFLSDVDMHRADLDPGWPEVEPALIR